MVLPGRGRHRPRPGAGRAAARHVRELHRLPRRLPHRRAARALRARRHALHQLPDHRAQGRDPGGRSAPASAATSSAATSARTSARGTASGAQRGGARVRAARPGCWRRTSDALAGARRGGVPRDASAGARSSGPSGGACCATWRWPSATRATGHAGRCWNGCSRTKIRSSASMRSGDSIVSTPARPRARRGPSPGPSSWSRPGSRRPCRGWRARRPSRPGLRRPRPSWPRCRRRGCRPRSRPRPCCRR